jgi:hypothetical protein
MKKLTSKLIILVLFFVLVFTGASTKVQAVCTDCTATTTTAVVPTSTPVPPAVESRWLLGGKEDTQHIVPMVNVPDGNLHWLQLMGSGINVSEPGKMCYSFRNYQYGWAGAIYQFINGKWKKLETSITWPEGSEGIPYACADAPAAGEYALFGSYTK